MTALTRRIRANVMRRTAGVGASCPARAFGHDGEHEGAYRAPRVDFGLGGGLEVTETGEPGRIDSQGVLVQTALLFPAP